MLFSEAGENFRLESVFKYGPVLSTRQNFMSLHVSTAVTVAELMLKKLVDKESSLENSHISFIWLTVLGVFSVNDLTYFKHMIFPSMENNIFDCKESTSYSIT